jgi:oligoribonuclease (3'-5' exoribonuclease)
MKYISLDIETTGLDSQKDQVLQVAMIVDDLENIKPISELPYINLYIQHDRYSGNAFALSLNYNILKILSRYNPGDHFTDSWGRRIDICTLEEASSYMVAFIKTHFQKRAIAAGKNVAGFDLTFLPKDVRDMFIHRVIDPGSMYMLKTDKIPPDTKLCCQRANISDEVTHDAYEDAAQIIELIRKKVL